EPMEDLRRAGLHPRAETGRHDDGRDRWSGAGTWGVHEGRRARAMVGAGDAVPTRTGPGACRGGVIEGGRMVWATPLSVKPSGAVAPWRPIASLTVCPSLMQEPSGRWLAERRLGPPGSVRSLQCSGWPCARPPIRDER